jgi:hypothetical protein
VEEALPSREGFFFEGCHRVLAAAAVGQLIIFVIPNVLDGVDAITRPAPRCTRVSPPLKLAPAPLPTAARRCGLWARVGRQGSMKPATAGGDRITDGNLSMDRSESTPHCAARS